MKAFPIVLAGLLVTSCLFGAAACDFGTGNGKDPGTQGGVETPDKDPDPKPDPTPSEELDLLEYGKYDLTTYLFPFWKGNVVYNETVWFADDYGAPLMYHPDKILSVKSYGLDKTYVEGVDYVMEKDGLSMTDDSAIPYMPYEEFYPLYADNNTQPLKDGSGFVYFSEGSDICNRQVAVTYIHRDEGDWTLPEVQTDKFPRTMEKLEKGEAVNVVFFGDSITVGANASSYVQCAPMAESYPEMVASYMKARYTDAKVNYVNTAVGGTESGWGAGKAGVFDPLPQEGDHFKVRVLDQHPDLLFIAFGMNDGPSDAAYKTNLRTMIDRAREADPNVEIMLVSGMTANPETTFYNKDYAAFEQAALDVAAEYENVGVSTVYSMVESLYNMGKRFRDWTGNNVNHPNDFMSRVYAQTILCALFGEDYIDCLMK